MKKIKLIINDEELRLIRYSLVDFRNALIRENKNADFIGEMLIRLKNKIKIDKYDLGLIINATNKKRKVMIEEKEDTSMINDLILRLIKLDDTLNK